MVVWYVRWVAEERRPEKEATGSTGRCSEKEINQMKEVDKSWLAALIDGEGCLQIDRQYRVNMYSYFPCISVSMTDRQMLDKAQMVTGFGKVKVCNRTTKTGKVIYRLVIRGKNTGEVLNQIQSYLLIKNKQAQLLLSMCHLIQIRKRKNSGDLQCARETLFVNNKRLNQREELI